MNEAERNKSELNAVLLIFHQVGLNVNLIHFYPRLPLILSFSLFQSISYFLSLISYFGFSPWTKTVFFFGEIQHISSPSDYLHYFYFILIEFRMWNAFIWLRFNQSFGIIFHTQLSSSFTTICNLHPKITNRTNLFFS